VAFATNDWKDGISWTGATSSTAGPFKLNGGRYLFGTTANGTSATLNVLAPDGSTYIPVTNGAFTTSAGTLVMDLCAGTYEVVIVSASAASGFLARVPYIAR
jgi:hypothetical protein